MKFIGRGCWLTALMAVVLWGGALSAEPMLSVGSTAGAPGSTVEVAVNYTTDSDTPALQFDLRYDTNYLTPGTPVGGSALADQEVDSAEPSPGVLRVLMFSFSDSSLTNGVLVYVPFSISSNAPDEDETLALTNVVVSSAQGEAVLAGASNGVLSIAVPPQFTAIFATTNGETHLQLSGTTGRSYVIEAETNLYPSQWIVLSTNVAVNGVVEFDDASAGAFPSRFYRAFFYMGE
jgi:hypothetical protein